MTERLHGVLKSISQREIPESIRRAGDQESEVTKRAIALLQPFTSMAMPPTACSWPFTDTGNL
jgi:hypothetical protein